MVERWRMTEVAGYVSLRACPQRIRRHGRAVHEHLQQVVVRVELEREGGRRAAARGRQEEDGRKRKGVNEAAHDRDGSGLRHGAPRVVACALQGLKGMVGV